MSHANIWDILNQFLIVCLRFKFNWASYILSSNLIPDPLLYKARGPGPWELGCNGMISLCCAFVGTLKKGNNNTPQKNKKQNQKNIKEQNM